MPKGIPKNGINRGWLKKGVIPLTAFKKGQKGLGRKKGSIPWNKGKKGLQVSWVKGLPKEKTPMFGKKHKTETIEKMKKNHKGFKGLHHTKQWGLEHSKRQSGENNHLWKGGITPINKKIRMSLEYKLWRTAVFKRDNFICIWCGSKEKIQADHIKRFADFPELRFAIDNGRTLCEPCHRTTDTWGARKSK